MIIILACVAAAMLWSCHDSWTGRRLRRWLVERPAAWLSRVTAGHLVLVVALLAVVAVAFQLFEMEGLKLAGSASLEAGAWFVAFDVGTYLEVYAVLWLLGATRQARMAFTVVRTLAAQAGRRAWRLCRGWARQTASRVRRSPPRERDENPDAAGWPHVALAA